eukprot:m.43758 g.43758  ORF g.43758 m.43758 type:complete len:863 (+) comp33476_c0_seq5:58-2646(+)
MAFRKAFPVFLLLVHLSEVETVAFKPNTTYIAVLQDESKPFVSEEQLMVLLDGATKVVSVFGHNSCDIACKSPAIHLSQACVSTFDFRIPVVTFPTDLGAEHNENVPCATEIGLGLSSKGQIKVAALAAGRFGWQNVLVWTDDEQGAQSLRQLGKEGGFNMLRVSGDRVEEVVNLMLTTSFSIVHAVVVHCDTATCYSGFIKMLKLWLDNSQANHKAIWLVTENVLWQIESDTYFWKDITVGSSVIDLQILGIERDLPKKTSSESLEKVLKREEHCEMLAYCPVADKRTRANLLFVHDAFVFLNHLLEKGSANRTNLANEELQLLSFEKPFGAADTIIVDSSRTGRIYSAYNVLKLSERKIEKVAHADGNDFMVFEYPVGKLSDVLGDQSRNRQKRQTQGHFGQCPPVKGPPYHFVVTSIEERPFLYLKNVTDTAHGINVTNTSKTNYQGLVVDLMDALQKRMGFTYTIITPLDSRYGKLEENENGTLISNGMIGQLLNCEADIAVGSLLVTSEREEYITFAGTCWLEASLSLFGYRQETKHRHWTAFLRPFSSRLWGMLLLIIFVFPLFVTTVRIFDSKETCPTFLTSYLESFWQLYTTLAQQGSETEEGEKIIDGKEDWNETEKGRRYFGQRISTWPSRVLFGGWFFFAIIVVATYTANLATFYVSDVIPSGLNNLDELADQTEVMYGTVKGSAIEEFFVNSPIEKYQKMGKYMTTTKNAMMENAEEGYRRVRENENYVFIWDELSLEYAVSTSPGCNTRLIGRDFNEGGYGLGMRQREEYQKNFTVTLLQLRDEQVIAQIRNRWFENGICLVDRSKSTQIGEPDQIDLLDFGGSFLILGVSVVLAFVALLIQTIGRRFC